VLAFVNISFLLKHIMGLPETFRDWGRCKSPKSIPNLGIK